VVCAKGTLGEWQLAQAPLKWPAGRRWQSAQAEEAGWPKTQLTPVFR
jgi:hypothetical protein